MDRRVQEDARIEALRALAAEAGAPEDMLAAAIMNGTTAQDAEKLFGEWARKGHVRFPCGAGWGEESRPEMTLEERRDG